MRIGGRSSALPEEGSSGASLMGRRRSIGCAEQPTQVGGLQPTEPMTRDRSEPESWPPVEPECRPPTQVGGFVPAQPEDTAPAKAGERPLGELEDATPVVLRVIKIETPEASVSGVFNLRALLFGLCSRHARRILAQKADVRPTRARSALTRKLGLRELGPRCRKLRRAPVPFRHNKDGGVVGSTSLNADP
jgi:hypothetical protein